MCDPYWSWWWTAIAAFLVLFLLCTQALALARKPYWHLWWMPVAY
jgi:hypothetical protein